MQTFHRYLRNRIDIRFTLRFFVYILSYNTDCSLLNLPFRFDSEGTHSILHSSSGLRGDRERFWASFDTRLNTISASVGLALRHTNIYLLEEYFFSSPVSISPIIHRRLETYTRCKERLVENYLYQIVSTDEVTRPLCHYDFGHWYGYILIA